LEVEAGLLCSGSLGFMPSESVGDTVDMYVDSDPSVAIDQTTFSRLPV
jgi:hypothetical protein